MDKKDTISKKITKGHFTKRTVTKKHFTKRKLTKKHFTKKNHTELVSTIKKYYPVAKFDTVDNKIKYEINDNKITYGEITYEGMDNLYENLNLKNVNCFIDIGSGRGKLCFYMATKPNIKHVLGIEIVEERHNDALEIMKKIDENEMSKIDLVNDDIFNLNFNMYSHLNTCIYLSNLCFTESITNKIFQKIHDEFPKGTIICFSKKSDFVVKLFTFVEIIKVSMSWDSDSSIYIYKL
jgi:tRNA G46 methylase TrmB